MVSSNITFWDITKDFMKVRRRAIEGKNIGLEYNLILKGSSRGKLRFTADFHSFCELESESTAPISKDTINIDNLYLLITYQHELIKSFSAYLQNDEVHLLWNHRQEWNTVYVKTETYLSETVTNTETKVRLYSLANKFVFEYFKISECEWEN
ncbi:13804_t:CDS:2 [Funneliformis caledonium]|uniref:13804_t:CDS:1 n=1 Tax=Funneliformis caledonium TaxID=1117310 RepID=A0A9N9B483_9GLOM|nr:13804_t:CDS:2 [Funneliformis caledonium]